MRKYPVPTTEQAELMKRQGINFPFLWVVTKEFARSFMIQNIVTKEVMLVDKV